MQSWFRRIDERYLRPLLETNVVTTNHELVNKLEELYVPGVFLCCAHIRFPFSLSIRVLPFLVLVPSQPRAAEMKQSPSVGKLPGTGGMPLSFSELSM